MVDYGGTKNAYEYAIQFVLGISNRVSRVVDEMSDAATQLQRRMAGAATPGFLGTSGAPVEGMIPATLFAEKNPAAEWQQYFGENSEACRRRPRRPAFALGAKKKTPPLSHRRLRSPSRAVEDTSPCTWSEGWIGAGVGDRLLSSRQSTVATLLRDFFLRRALLESCPQPA